MPHDALRTANPFSGRSLNRSDPPKSDELEISIIGPGRGECIVIHLGNNEWCVVDSCIARGQREPAVVEYLDELHCGALERVRLIVATHWHDDHIRGLASIVDKVPNSLFSCSTALESDYFLTLVELSNLSVQGRSGVEEFKSIFDLLKSRMEKADQMLASPMLAIENRELLHLEDMSRPFSASVKALSPSDGTVKTALASFAKLLPKEGQPQQRIVNTSPNASSVVLWVEVGRARVLLGADLEHTGRSADGWNAVLASKHDLGKATVFKVPHHGSANADCEDVWKQMLTPQPVAVVTPFSSGKALPTDSDLQRLSSRTRSLYCTARSTGHPPRRESMVEKKLKGVVSERRVIEGAPGHIRVRWSVMDEHSEPSVELFNGAFHVSPPTPRAPA